MPTYQISDVITYGILNFYRSNSNGVVNTVYPGLAHGLVHEVKGPDLIPKRRRPKGYLYPTEYRHYGSTQEYYGVKQMYAAGHATSTNTDYVYSGVDTQNKVEFNLGSFDPIVANKALLNCLRNLKGAKVNYAVAFAEAGQTAGLIAGTATKIAKAVDAAKRGNLRGVRRALGITSPASQKAQDLSRAARKEYRKWWRTGKARNLPEPALARDRSNAHNLFLEHQFGWLPLLSDVKGGAEEIARLATEDKLASVATGSSSFKRVIGAVTSDVNAYGSFPATRKRYQEFTYKAYVRLDFSVSSPGLHALAQTGISNPLSVAWEKLPFSFVADWFVPVGAVIDSLDSTLGMTFRSGSISKKMTGKVSDSFANRSGTISGWSNLVVSGFGEATAFDLERLVYTSFPHPTVTLPRNPFSSGNKVAKAVALIAQKFGR